MFTYECVLAAALVSAPVDSFTATDLEGWWGPLQHPLVQLALETEILDPRETKCVIVRSDAFAGDLREMQRRFAEMLHAPLLEECQRFPERLIVTEFLAFNRAYRFDLTAQLALDLVHADELRLTLCETDRLYLVWDTLRDARCEYYYVTVRRRSLQHLRDLLGADSFYRGELPPHIPVWRLPATSSN